MVPPIAIRCRPRAPFLKFARNTAARANITRARSHSGPESALGRPARSLRAGDRNQRAQRERNPFDREPVH
jgi:hypothetical protein